MTVQVQQIGARELDSRSGDGIDVALFWEPLTNRVFVLVANERTNDRFRIDVDAAHALDAFHHPYVYDVRRDREPVAA